MRIRSSGSAAAYVAVVLAATPAIAQILPSTPVALGQASHPSPAQDAAASPQPGAPAAGAATTGPTVPATPPASVSPAAATAASAAAATDASGPSSTPTPALPRDGALASAMRPGLPTDLSVAAMFAHADAVVKTVMIGLILASVATWTILLAKGISILLARRSLHRALQCAEAESSLEVLQLHLRGRSRDAIERHMTEATAAELQLSQRQDPAGIKERVASRLERLNAGAGRRMGRGTGVLATIGSTAPFVGLFGTVWGIMNSFIGISQMQTTSLAVVAPGIAEALLATATGLVAAIPAVVIYNVFARAITGYRVMMTDYAAIILRLISRELDRRGSVHTAAAE